jgi:hypothetical protein
MLEVPLAIALQLRPLVGREGVTHRDHLSIELHSHHNLGWEGGLRRGTPGATVPT